MGDKCEHVLLQVLKFTMIIKIILLQVHGVAWTPGPSVSETELNTHSVTPAVVSTMPNTAPEREGGVCLIIIIKNDSLLGYGTDNILKYASFPGNVEKEGACG